MANTSMTTNTLSYWTQASWNDFNPSWEEYLNHKQAPKSKAAKLSIQESFREEDIRFLNGPRATVRKEQV